MFKIGCAWVIYMGGLGGPHGSAASSPNQNWLAYPDAWLSLLEPSVWRCGTCVQAYSKRVARVGPYSTITYMLSQIITNSPFNIHLSNFNPNPCGWGRI
jgi:hypothetical protein